MERLETRLLGTARWRMFAQPVVVPWVLRCSDLPSVGDVIEVGCGGGFDTEVLLHAFPAGG